MAEEKAYIVTDEQLVPALQKGDEDAFAELMRRYQSRVFGMVCRYLGDYDEASDVAQEVFVSVFRHIKDFSGRSRLSTWIYRIAANMAVNALRSRNRRVVSMAESLDELNDQEDRPRIEPVAGIKSDPREQLHQKELDAALQVKLQELPESYRMTFILREMRQMSYDEIAEVTDVPVGTVRSRLHQARQRLREMLAPYLGMDSSRIKVIER
ncbi:MAG: sigma-70 family RNA polymerase sigma factor [Candidatus Sumerlaeota bacterium]|nr:sigma-70 family RNA polymerase sigma factor [Candidatus Sumerlaeota bacterium]